MDDSASSVSSQTVIVDVLANDRDCDDGRLSVQSVDAATNGTTQVRPTNESLWNEFAEYGSMYGYSDFDLFYSEYYGEDPSALDYHVAYTPDAGFVGTDTFSYTIVGNDGVADSATVTVNVAANSQPVFGETEYVLSVPIDAAEGTVVGTLSATDADGHTVSYAGDDDTFFVNDNGEVILSYAYDLQYSGVGGSYAFTATASDGLEEASVNVNVQVTESQEVLSNTAPVFDQPNYSFDVPADAADGVVVGSLVATDTDGETITYSTDDYTFSVNTNGEVILNYAYDLEYTGVGGSYAFTVTASDGLEETSIDVIVNVTGTDTNDTDTNDTDTNDTDTNDTDTNDTDTNDTDTNDTDTNDTDTNDTDTNDTDTNDTDTNDTDTNDTPPANAAPVFGQSSYAFDVSTDVAVNTVIGTIYASDIDGDNITYALSDSSVFRIDSTGQLLVSDTGSIQNTQTPQIHTLTVSASDGTAVADAAVVITVVPTTPATDENDDTDIITVGPVELDYVSILRNSPIAEQLAPFFQQIHTALIDAQEAADNAQEHTEEEAEQVADVASDEAEGGEELGEEEEGEEDQTAVRVGSVLSAEFVYPELTLPAEELTENLFDLQPTGTETFENVIVENLEPTVETGGTAQETDTTDETADNAADDDDITAAATTETRLQQNYVSPAEYTITQIITNNYTKTAPLVTPETQPDTTDEQTEENTTEPADGTAEDSAAPDEEADNGTQTQTLQEQYSVTVVNGTQTVTTYTYTSHLSAGIGTIPGMEDSDTLTIPDTWKSAAQGPDRNDQTADGEAVDDLDKDKNQDDGNVWDDIFNRSPEDKDNPDSTPPADGDEDQNASGARMASSASITVTITETLTTLPDGTPATTTTVSFGTSSSFTTMSAGSFSHNESEGTLTTLMPDEAADGDETDDGGGTETPPEGTAQPITEDTPPEIGDVALEGDDAEDDTSNRLRLDDLSAGGNGNSMDAGSNYMNYAHASTSFDADLTTTIADTDDWLPSVTASGSVSFSLAFGYGGRTGSNILFEDQTSSGSEADSTDQFEYLLYSDISDGGHYTDFSFGISVTFGDEDASDAETLPEDGNPDTPDDDNSPSGNHLTFSTGSHSSRDNITAYAGFSRPSIVDTSGQLYLADSTSSGFTDFSFGLDADGLDIDYTTTSDAEHNESGGSIRTFKMYGDLDTSFVPDGATWYEFRTRTETVFEETRTSSGTTTFGLDSEGLTFSNESSVTDEGAGSKTDESQEHSVLLDGSDDIRTYTQTDGYEYDLESVDRGYVTGFSTVSNEIRYDGYENAPIDSLSTTTVNYGDTGEDGDTETNNYWNTGEEDAGGGTDSTNTDNTEQTANWAETQNDETTDNNEDPASNQGGYILTVAPQGGGRSVNIYVVNRDGNPLVGQLRPGLASQHIDLVIPGRGLVGYFGFRRPQTNALIPGITGGMQGHLNNTLHEWEHGPTERARSVADPPHSQLSTIVRVRITQDQLSKIQAAIDKLDSNPGDFNLVGNNCSMNACNILMEGGLLDGRNAPIGLPNELIDALVAEERGRVFGGYTSVIRQDRNGDGNLHVRIRDRQGNPIAVVPDSLPEQ